MSLSLMILTVIIAKCLSRVKYVFFEFSIIKMNSAYENIALRGELSANLVGFCRYLRLNGLKPGMGEQMDALRALEKVDFENETSFRMALRTTLAKSTKEQEIFDEHFHPFWDVWDKAENLYNQSNAKQEESSVITLENSSKNKSLLCSFISLLLFTNFSKKSESNFKFSFFIDNPAAI